MRKLSILSIAFMSLLVFSAPAFAASDKGGVKAQPCSKKAKKSKLKRCKVQLPATKPVSTTKPPKPSTKPFPVISESASEVKLPKPSTEPFPVVSESASEVKLPKPSTKPFPVVSESASEVKLPKPSTEPLPVISESASEVKLPKPSTEPLPIVETVIESKPIHCLSTDCPPLVDKPIHCLSTRCSCKVQLPVTKPISGTKPAKGSGSAEQVLLPASESIKEGKYCPVKLPVEPVNSYRAQ